MAQSKSWQPLSLASPIQQRPLAPVTTTPSQSPQELLRLDALEWPAFESLLWRILRDVEGLRQPQIYGNPGQTQLGIDLVAVAPDETGVAVQSKRHKDFGPAKITSAVDAFTDTTRPFDVSKFIIGVSREVRTTAAVDKVLELRKSLKPVQFEIWDQRELSMKLKRSPRIVIDYFGLDIAQAFCEPFVIDEILVPGHDAVAVAEAVARTPEATTGAGALIEHASEVAEGDPAAALDLITTAQGRLADAGFMPHAARYEAMLAPLLVALDRAPEASRRRLDQLWEALDEGLLVSAEIAGRDIANLAAQVEYDSCDEDRLVAEQALLLYANPLAAVPELETLSVGSASDRAKLAVLAGETALAADETEWLTSNAASLLALADVDDAITSVRLRLLAAEGASDWATLLHEARTTRLGFALGGLVTARYARHQALTGAFGEADASWDEATGAACLASRWSDAATWTFSRRVFASRWKPFRGDDLLPVQSALAGRGPSRTTLPRDDDALIYAFSQLREDKLRSAAIAAQRALRDAITSSDWEGERRARRLLADTLSRSGEATRAAVHLARAGDVKATKKLAADNPNTYLDVTHLLADTSYWVCGTAFRLIAAQGDLVPDDTVSTVTEAILAVLEAADAGTLVDLSGWETSRYLGAVAALATIAPRLTADESDHALSHFEGQAPLEANQSRFHDDNEAVTVAAIATAQPDLRERTLNHLVVLLSRSQTARTSTTVQPIDDHIDQARPLLEALAADDNGWARELLASFDPASVPEPVAEAALIRLIAPLEHHPGVSTSGSSAAVSDSVLVLNLPAPRLEPALGELLNRADDPRLSSSDRATNLIAASNLAPRLDPETTGTHLDTALRLAQAPSQSQVDTFEAQYSHPLGGMRMTGPRDSRSQAAYLAACLADTDIDKNRVRTVALGLVGDAVSDYWLTRTFQRLGEAMSPDVGFLSGGDWALRSLAAILWAKSGNPPRVGHRLAADLDPRVRRALARELAAQTSHATIDDDRQEVRLLLTTDPCYSVRHASICETDTSSQSLA